MYCVLLWLATWGTAFPHWGGVCSFWQAADWDEQPGDLKGWKQSCWAVHEFGDLDTLSEVPCPLAPFWTRAHHSQSIAYTTGPIQGDPSNKKVQLNIWDLNLFSLLLAKQIEWGNDLQFKLLLKGRIPSLLVSILARPGQEKKNLFLKTLRVNHTHIF